MNEGKFKTDAMFDKNNAFVGHGIGHYKCYCDMIGASLEMTKSDICYDYFYMVFYGKLLGNAASVLVVVFNIASRKVVIGLIEKIGLPT